ncbi:MAG: hypothetical protein ACPIOQ_65995, partial [Promethearchaeia archaeon]
MFFFEITVARKEYTNNQCTNAISAILPFVAFRTSPTSKSSCHGESHTDMAFVVIFWIDDRFQIVLKTRNQICSAVEVEVVARLAKIRYKFGFLLLLHLLL